MKHFENNVNDGMSRTDSSETLIDLTSCIAVNALMVAGGEAEQAAKRVMRIVFGIKED